MRGRSCRRPRPSWRISFAFRRSLGGNGGVADPDQPAAQHALGIGLSPHGVLRGQTTRRRPGPTLTTSSSKGRSTAREPAAAASSASTTATATATATTTTTTTTTTPARWGYRSKAEIVASISAALRAAMASRKAAVHGCAGPPAFSRPEARDN
jgi:hypothetical protein